ncbi:unnamed protein product [Meloidogyne enterolobii]|uniref:Uncharacterized protein n=1 Tax=Meloidogyne enterolobii TaxID=390850 RepID=A0ACB0Z430_MELEN
MQQSPDKNDSLSLLESTNRDSNFSTYQADREQLERLKSHNRVLECEFADLRRQMPILKDAEGKDVTAEFAKLARELQKYKDECDNWAEQHRNLLKKHDDFEQNTMEEIGIRDKQLENLKKIGFELEDENAQLREKLQDEIAKNKHVEQAAVVGHGLEHSLEELHIRDQIRNSIAKIPGYPISSFSNLYLLGLSSAQIAAQFNESFADLNPDDAEQIAAHIFMILEKLENNTRANEELRSGIFAFLSQHGFNADEKKFATFSGVIKEMLQKRQNEIRAANDRLGTKFGGSIGGKEFEACMRQLNQDSLSFSNTLPGGAADAVLARQSINTTIFESENVTMESVAAMHLAEQTANIAESCVKMFDRLRGTAEFFLQLLETISEGGESELGKELMQKIESLRLDLNKSMGDARSILVEAKDAEKNARSFLEQTLHQVSVMNSTVYSTISNQSRMVVDVGTSAMEPGICVMEPSPKLPQSKEIIESICGELNRIYDTMFVLLDFLKNFLIKIFRSDVCTSSKKIAPKTGKGTSKSGTSTSKKSSGVNKNKNDGQFKKPKNETKGDKRN